MSRKYNIYLVNLVSSVNDWVSEVTMMIQWSQCILFIYFFYNLLIAYLSVTLASEFKLMCKNSFHHVHCIEIECFSSIRSIQWNTPWGISLIYEPRMASTTNQLLEPRSNYSLLKQAHTNIWSTVHTIDTYIIYEEAESISIKKPTCTSNVWLLGACGYRKGCKYV